MSYPSNKDLKAKHLCGKCCKSVSLEDAVNKVSGVEKTLSEDIVSEAMK
jgi:hypothetical protein